MADNARTAQSGWQMLLSHLLVWPRIEAGYLERRSGLSPERFKESMANLQRVAPVKKHTKGHMTWYRLDKRAMHDRMRIGKAEQLRQKEANQMLQAQTFALPGLTGYATSVQEPRELHVEIIHSDEGWCWELVDGDEVHATSWGWCSTQREALSKWEGFESLMGRVGGAIPVTCPQEMAVTG